MMELQQARLFTLYCLRPFLYGLHHNIDFGNQHDGKQNQEDKESYLIAKGKREKEISKLIKKMPIRV